MSRKCQICGKERMIAMGRVKLRGKYNPTEKREQRVNLQWVAVPIDAKKDFKEFSGKRVLACTKCKKTLLKNK